MLCRRISTSVDVDNLTQLLQAAASAFAQGSPPMPHRAEPGISHGHSGTVGGTAGSACAGFPTCQSDGAAACSCTTAGGLPASKKRGAGACSPRLAENSTAPQQRLLWRGCGSTSAPAVDSPGVLRHLAAVFFMLAVYPLHVHCASSRSRSASPEHRRGSAAVSDRPPQPPRPGPQIWAGRGPRTQAGSSGQP